MDRGAWRATVYGVTEELDSTVYLNNNEDELRPLPLTAFRGEPPLSSGGMGQPHLLHLPFVGWPCLLAVFCLSCSSR